MTPQIVQIRVDFISLVLGSPVQGECRNDSLLFMFMFIFSLCLFLFFYLFAGMTPS